MEPTQPPYTSLSTKSLILRDVYLSPQIIKNVISIRKFTIDNSISIEFDPSDFFCEGPLHEENYNEI